MRHLKRKRTVARLLSLAGFVIVAGCATVGPEDVEEGRWKKIKQSGVAEDVSHNMLLGTVTEKGKTNYFSPDDEKVTWWALFALYTFPAPDLVTFHAKWYDPDGNVFFEDDFELHKKGWDPTFAKTVLPLNRTPAGKFPGLWRVEVTYKGVKIDDQKFYMGTEGPPQKTPAPRAETVSEAWETPPPREEPEDPFYQKHHKRAQIYFERGNYEAAKRHLQTILEQQPFRTEAHLSLSAVYYQEGRWDDVLKELDYTLQHPDYRATALKIRSAVLEIKEKGKPA